MRKGNHSMTRAVALAIACAVSVGSFPVQAAVKDETMRTYLDGTSSESYVYGTVNVPYADYYYGEMNKVEENAALALDAEDKVAALREKGYLDAISSATTDGEKNGKPTSAKWRGGYGSTYYADHENNDGGGYIYGIGDCSVAIPTELYETVKTLNDEQKAACKTALVSLVDGFKANEDQTVPAEYKVLNGDGTLTATVDSAEVVKIDTTAADSKAEAKLVDETETKYGHFEIDIEDEIEEYTDVDSEGKEVTKTRNKNMPDGKTNLEGAILETSDGKQYALQHSDNLWFQAQKIAFSVADGKVSHGNALKYKQFADLQGKTITKIRYIVRGGADVEYTTSLTVPYLLGNGQGVTADNKAGAAISFTENLPEDSKYGLKVVYKGESTADKQKVELTADQDYTYDAEKDTLTIKDTEKTKAGKYVAVFADASKKYSSAVVTFEYTVDVEVLQKAVNSAKALKEADYTAATWKTVKEALETAEKALEADNQETVDKAASNLTSAVNALKKTETQQPTTQQPTTQQPTTQQPTTQQPATTEQPTAQQPATTEQPTTTEEKASVKKGDTYTKGSLKYKVTKADLTGKGTVEVTGPTKKTVTSVTIPATVEIKGASFKVTTIGKNAFKNCSKLKKITIKTKDLKKVGSNAFKGIHKNAKIKVPSSKLTKYKTLLKGKGQGKNVKIKK